MTRPSVAAAPTLEIPVAAWASWADGEEMVSTGGAASPAPPLPALLRRRVTAIGRRALETAWAITAGLGGSAPRIILSSRHGEYSRTMDLLRSLAESGEASPAEFSLAVHHGLAGLLSIATGNRAGHTAIAAGADTLGAALQEAAGCLAEGDSGVLLMHFDEPLPTEYDLVGGGAEPRLALALLLGGEGRRLRLSWRPLDNGTGCGPAMSLLRLLRDEAVPEASPGDRMTWSLSYAA